MVDLSVVVPVYGCDDCLTDLHGRLRAALDGVAGSHELVFVEDGSPDGSWRTLAQLARSDPAVRAHRLSRNFGEEAAITAGLAQSRGRWAVVMDCDLQDSPEAIPALYAKAQEGYDVVFAKRKGRRHSRVRTAASKLYFRLLKALLGADIDAEHGNFSILSRKVVDHFLETRDKDRHFRAIIYWLGFRRTAIDVQHEPRRSGKSSYGFGALLKHAMDGVFFQTAVLMRWVVLLGFVVALAGVLLAAFFVYSYFVADRPYPGWTSLAVLILLMSGFIIISTGVAGLYIGKIFSQVKDRPLYIIEESVGGGEER
jgi:glycosyltransferase involved in cell wall biosynthesis